jgi:hypothetical protein
MVIVRVSRDDAEIGTVVFVYDVDKNAASIEEKNT